MTKRSSYTTAFKLQAVDYAENSGYRSAARHFDIDKNKVRLWEKSRVQIP